MEFKEVIKKILTIKNEYNNLNKKRGEKVWELNAYMEWFVWDVWDLSKLIIAKQWYRTIENYDEKLSQELFDCLFSIVAIADELYIDLEEEFSKNSANLEKRVKEIDEEYTEKI